MRYNNKSISRILFILFLSSIISTTSFFSPILNVQGENLIEKSGTEYWGLLFAVGVYKNNPNQDRPSMLSAVDNLYDSLIESEEWLPSHIHVVKGTEATGQRLVQELLWLITNEDSDDMSLIYITTHGAPLRDPETREPIDLPPIDEADGADEILVMYEGFDTWYSFIWDDLLNFFLSLLQSKGVCLIVDSCYSGGFNDHLSTETKKETYTSEMFAKDITEELSKNNRIILMSSEEDTVSYGSHFTNYIAEGLYGEADIKFGNKNGITSAEEAFYYSQYKVNLLGMQHPTIYDRYTGDFPLATYK